MELRHAPGHRTSPWRGGPTRRITSCHAIAICIVLANLSWKNNTDVGCADGPARTKVLAQQPNESTPTDTGSTLLGHRPHHKASQRRHMPFRVDTANTGTPVYVATEIFWEQTKPALKRELHLPNARSLWFLGLPSLFSFSQSCERSLNRLSMVTMSIVAHRADCCIRST